MGQTLWPFQRDGLNRGRALYAGHGGKERCRAVLFVGPTGMGKTTLAGEAARGHVAKGGRVVAIAHRRELISQMAARMRQFDLDVGCFGEGSSASVQVTSIQEILASRRMPPASFVIIDEAHHYAAAEWSMPVREYLKSGASIMGLTATPERGDGVGLGQQVGGVFDGLIVVAQVRDLIAINADDDTKGVTSIEIVEPKASVKHLAKHPHEAWQNWARERYVAVFAPNVKNANAFADGFKAAGVEALVITGEMPTADRDQIIARFACGDLRVLVNVGVLTEGWDAPICDCVIVARKCGSFSLLRQIVGRARRARAGKKSALYIDLADNITLHGHPDSDIDYDLDHGMSLAGSRVKPGDRKCRVCGRVLADDLDMAKAEGRELTHCSECNTKLSRIELITPEDVELGKLREDEKRRGVTRDTRVKALATMYEREIRKRGKRSVAENAYRTIFRSGFPPNDVRVASWRIAQQRVKEDEQ